MDKQFKVNWPIISLPMQLLMLSYFTMVKCYIITGFCSIILCTSCDQKDHGKHQKANPKTFNKQNFSMRFRRKKFRHNFLILLVFMSLFSSPTTWSNNNSIWNKTSLKSLEKRKKKKYIIEFLLEKTGLKVKTSNFFFTKVLSRKMQRFLWA